MEDRDAHSRRATVRGARKQRGARESEGALALVGCMEGMKSLAEFNLYRIDDPEKASLPGPHR